MANDAAAGIAVDALQAEIDQAILDIRDKPAQPGCDAHSAMARGLIVLLRCERAALAQTRRTMLLAAWTAALGSSGLTAGAVGYMMHKPPPTQLEQAK